MNVQIWVYGNSFESFLVCVAVPERKTVEEWAKTKDIAQDFESLCNNPELKIYILNELNKIGRDHKVRINIYGSDRRNSEMVD